ncbi:PP2C-like domain-containing protein CG9801 isoform X2 [Aethina tumida]|uniref:PP2C-like domain-containing protein CG9801 isoform X2 n=1 Tax=Aethina tumida TaxID=116153 RepID=UPI0021483D02|nr:PP2C-like domain-containing protein CG9801 isoform X2 [Aethina tumida]
MPSLRKRVSSYFRQLSFHNEPRDKKHNINENSFVTKYLQGQITLKEGPEIIYGKNPTDLPNYELGKYESGADSIIGCYSGPNGGLTTVKRTEKHLSVLDADIDFIDTTDDVAEDAPEVSNIPSVVINDSSLPNEWNRKSDFVYGLSDSLYDRNQVTKNKNGDPIADCFGIIARHDSAILAVADGVNWGEKACIAAKSAVHGCLHYLDKTIFNDTKPFDDLTIKSDDSAPTSLSIADARPENLIKNTREVFVCLLRAFNCAHDLILENKGMLTTLTVAIVLPLKQRARRNGEEQGTRYICCVCNVGDTLAYVYSQKYGVRELTKGSHDINCNRDMRDALGALGPVDGINPELSNLTLSITTLNEGDIVLVASDGLTDNFDPNVCKFTVNANVAEPQKPKRQPPQKEVIKPPRIKNPPTVEQRPKQPEPRTDRTTTETAAKPPIKPPRRSKMNRDSVERASIKSNTPSMQSTVSTDNSSSVPDDWQSQSSTSISVSTSDHLANASRTDAPPANHSRSPSANPDPELENNPLVAQFVKQNALPPPQQQQVQKKTASLDARRSTAVVDNRASSLRKQSGVKASAQTQTGRDRKPKQDAKQQKSATVKETTGYKFLRSKTSIDFTRSSITTKQISRNAEGVPYVTPIQRYELQLLLIEDVLRNGISGKDQPCRTAKRLCENLVNFTLSITSAKRHTLEDVDLYFDNRNGVLVEVTAMEKKLRRKKGLERVQNLPGKLDHVTVVAYNVGNTWS